MFAEYLYSTLSYKSPYLVKVAWLVKKGSVIDSRAAACRVWYKDPKTSKPGPTLFELLDSTEVPPRDALAPFRMAVIDKFKDLGTVVMGKSEAGCVRKGDSLLVMPNRCVTAAVVFDAVL